MLILLTPAWLGATAPRFAPDWFKKGQETLPIVVALEYPPYRSLSMEGGGFQVQIIQAVFAKAGMDVEVDIQPAKSLMIYALSQEGTPAVIGEKADFKDIPSKQLAFVPFHVQTENYFYRAGDERFIDSDGKLESMKGRTIGLESLPQTDVYDKMGIRVLLGKLPDLLEKLLNGEIDLVAADADRVNWTLNERFPKNNKGVVPIKMSVWHSFSFAVFNTEYKNGRLFSGRFADAVKTMLKDGSYEGLLKNIPGAHALTPEQKKELEIYLEAIETKGK